MKCSEIMNSDFRTVTPTEPVLAAVRVMRDAYVHFVCVCTENGHPLGVVNEYDVIEGVCSVDRRPSEVLVHDVMSRQYTVCDTEEDVNVLIGLLLRSGQPRALITEGTGRLVGLITWTDLLHYLAPIQARELALKHIEHGFRVRGRSSTPPPPPGTETKSASSGASVSASTQALQQVLLEGARG